MTEVVTDVGWGILVGLQGEEAERVLALGRRRRFARREVVWHEGDTADTVHVIRSGRIAIQSLTALGELATVAVLSVGEAAGLIAVHATDPYHATGAVALEPTETLAIRLDALTELRHSVPEVDDAIVRFLADRVLDIALQLVDAMYVPAEIRVLRRLLALADVYGGEDSEVLIPLTQEDVAGLAGVTRPTVNRVLKKEEQRGTIRLSRGSITILDRGRLSARAS
jgi:CRP/FNR family transcriptional regulator, cyclic AMP receptor protein